MRIWFSPGGRSSEGKPSPIAPKPSCSILTTIQGGSSFKRNFDLGVSQADHPEVFGAAPSESEGIRLVKRTASYLLKKKKVWLLPVLVYQSGCKYLGYRLGKGYRKLPRWAIRRCTDNLCYWEKIWG